MIPNGDMYAGCDAVHAYLMKNPPTVDLNDTALYHCGPVMLKNGIGDTMWHLRAQAFAAIVTMDAHGNSLHAGVEQESGSALEALESV